MRRSESIGIWLVCMAALLLPLRTRALDGNGDTATTARAPIVLELFTSEGCSSCPPVDAWVERMNSMQPIPGAQIIVLSEHVTYWNHDGWSDPYSTDQMTSRQQQYVYKLSLSGVYTPQMILDGDKELRIQNSQQVGQALQAAALTNGVKIEASGKTVDDKKGKVVQGMVEASAGTPDQHGDVYVALALRRAASQVSSGENKGRDLSYTNVVEHIVKVGQLKKGEAFQGTFRIKLDKGTDPANLRIVAFVQKSGQGRILGAAIGTMTP